MKRPSPPDGLAVEREHDRADEGECDETEEDENGWSDHPVGQGIIAAKDALELQTLRAAGSRRHNVCHNHEHYTGRGERSIDPTPACTFEQTTNIGERRHEAAQDETPEGIGRFSGRLGKGGVI